MSILTPLTTRTGLIASGAYTIGLWYLSGHGIWNRPDHRWAFLGGFDWQVRFLEPVRPGEEMRLWVQITDARRSRTPRRGILTATTELQRQPDANPVLGVDAVVMVATRPTDVRFSVTPVRYVGGMDEIRTIDSLEADFAELTAAVSRLDSLRLQTLRELDLAQAATVDGARTMIEWVAGRFDLETSTVRTLLTLARAGDHDLEAELEDGRVTTDRAAAVVGLRAAGAEDAAVEHSWGRDLAGVRQMTSAHRRISSRGEADSFSDRYLHMQPSLDESTWKLWGQLPGIDGRIVDKAIQTAVDTLPHNPDTTAGQDRADGLVSVASEWLSGEVGGHDLVAEIFIDSALATVTNGEVGASIVSGPRIGPNTLGEILCAGTTRINLIDNTGTVSTTPSSRAIPGAIRNRVLQRDGHRCVIAGCNSRTRLQPHHLVPYAQGGTHDLENLITVCWYHHHVVIHQQGMAIDPASPPQRRTFLRARPVRAGP